MHAIPCEDRPRLLKGRRGPKPRLSMSVPHTASTAGGLADTYLRGTDMKKSSILIAATALITGLFASPALANNAPPALTATAVCSGKWVVVTVDAPDEAKILAKRPDGNWIAYGNKFVPDTSGNNPAGDYDIVMDLERLQGNERGGMNVVQVGSVQTPNCGPKTLCVPMDDERHTTCTLTPLVRADADVEWVTEPTPAPEAPKLITVADKTYDVWPAIVEAISIRL